MDFVIRKATLNDLDAITKLRLELLKDLGDVNDANKSEVWSANQNYFKEKLSRGCFFAWVGEVKETIVAISGLVFFERPPHGENISGLEAYIMNMYTKPGYRGYGIASSILEKCVSECKCLGVGRIWLHSSQEGYTLYKKMGFTEKNSELELIL